MAESRDASPSWIPPSEGAVTERRRLAVRCEAQTVECGRSRQTARGRCFHVWSGGVTTIQQVRSRRCLCASCSSWRSRGKASRTRSRAPCIRVPVQLAHRLAAVLMAEVQRDVARVQLQHFPGVPAEVVPGRCIQVDVVAEDLRPSRVRLRRPSGRPLRYLVQFSDGGSGTRFRAAYFPSITSVALIRMVTASPSARASCSTLPRVIAATIS
jgi:hypothetical protein